MMFRKLLLIAIICLLSLHYGMSNKKQDPKECEVCVKVIDDIKSTFQSLVKEGEKSSVGTGEKAVEKKCGKKKKQNPKDNKLCYNLLPMKKDVARQVSFSKDSMKICQSLKKKNPDFCTMRYPIKTSTDTDYSKMRVKHLKQILSDRGVDCRGCIEKQDYIKRVKETEHMEL